MTVECMKQRNGSQFEPLSLNFIESRGTRLLTLAGGAAGQEKMPASALAVLHQLQLSDSGLGCTNKVWWEAVKAAVGIGRRTFLTCLKWLVQNGYVHQPAKRRYALTEQGREKVQVQL